MTKFRIVVLCAEEALTNQIFDRIRKNFAVVPIDLVKVESGKRLLQELRETPTQLAIVAEAFPGGSLKDLVQSILMISGEISVIGLRSSPDLQIDGVIFADLPVKSWTEFLGIVQETMPDKMKARFGLKSVRTELIRQLQNYGAKYLTEADRAGSKFLAFALVPSNFIGGNANLVHGPQRKELAEGKVAFGAKRFYWKYEAAFVLVLIAVASVFNFWIESERLLSLRNMATALAGFSIIGFLSARVLERVIVTSVAEKFEGRSEERDPSLS